MLREAKVLSVSEKQMDVWGDLPSAEDRCGRWKILRRIFEGQEHLLCNLTLEQMDYLYLVVTYRFAKARNDEAEVESLLRPLDEEWAKKMASQLKEQREIILKTVPLPIIELSLVDPNDPIELEKTLAHLQGFPPDLSV